MVYRSSLFNVLERTGRSPSLMLLVKYWWCASLHKGIKVNEAAGPGKPENLMPKLDPITDPHPQGRQRLKLA